MNAETVNRWMTESATAIAEQRDYLTQLDAAIGDADHGANMNRGFVAVQAKLAEAGDGEPPGQDLVTAGSTLVSTVGGASRAAVGHRSAARRASRSASRDDRAARHSPTRCKRRWTAWWSWARRSPETRPWWTRCNPPSAAMKASLADGADVATAVAAASAAADEGMRATTPMLAKKGRASYLGERSIGHQDPGATSASIIIAALERAVTEAP